MSRYPSSSRTVVAGVLLALVAVSACSDLKTGEPGRALDRGIRALVVSDGGPPGVAVVVQQGSTRSFHTSGVASLDTRERIELDDHTRVASVAKAFSGAAATDLVSAGRLSLDDTVGQRVADLPPQWSAITLRQLLQHTSGIPDFSQSEAFQNALVASLLVAPPPRQLLTFVEDEPLGFAPGSRYEYSNSDNIVVGLMVEEAAGRPYTEVLDERVFGPDRLEETSLPSGPVLPKPRINGYDVTETPPDDITEQFAAGWTWASGGIVSTPADANRFIRAYVPRVLAYEGTGPGKFQFIDGGSSEPPGPGQNAAGTAIFRYQTRCGTVYGHTGNTPGYTQFVAASRDGTRSVSVSINAQIVPKSNPTRFAELRDVFELAVCDALR